MCIRDRNGVGPKVGIAILSAFTPDRLSLIISSGDAKSLTQAGGVGPKLAQRIVLELKDKVSGGADGEVLSDLASSAQGGAVAEAINAPVSYTHLDVYKRQACGSRLRRI